MKNKGFSMVELIIVIAIMAILAGALAPALIKYINKSRISTDISNGQQIASAIQTALSNEKAYDAAPTCTQSDFSGLIAGNDDFCKEVKSVIGDTAPTGKAKKDVNGTGTDQKFYVTLNPTGNEVTVYAGSTGANYTVYPAVGSAWSN